MKLSIVVPRAAMSVNETYGVNRNAKRPFYKTTAAKEFQEAIRAHAFVAARHGKWPQPETIKRRSVTVEIIICGSDVDVDGPIKLALDALQGILYTKDSAVRKVSSEYDENEPKRQVIINVETKE